MEYNIGDIVTVKQLDKQAEIIDKLFSENEQEYLYRVTLTGAKTSPRALFAADDLETFKEEGVEYTHSIENLDGVVLVKLYEIKGDQTTEIARGHGHIIHNGALGIAQATGYAFHRITEQLREAQHG